jgi:hypothetical protein
MSKAKRVTLIVFHVNSIEPEKGPELRQEFHVYSIEPEKGPELRQEFHVPG